MTLDIHELRRYCGTEEIVYAKHFVDRCRGRNIRLDDAENAILTGEIIEDYPDDYPFPSCLILGRDLGHNKKKRGGKPGGRVCFIEQECEIRILKGKADRGVRPVFTGILQPAQIALMGRCQGGGFNQLHQTILLWTHSS